MPPLPGVWSIFFQTNKADAMTLDGGSMFDAGMAPYKLRPIAAEVYGTKTREFFLGTLKPGGCVVAMDEALWSQNG